MSNLVDESVAGNLVSLWRSVIVLLLIATNKVAFIKPKHNRHIK